QPPTSDPRNDDDQRHRPPPHDRSSVHRERGSAPPSRHREGVRRLRRAHLLRAGHPARRRGARRRHRPRHSRRSARGSPRRRTLMEWFVKAFLKASLAWLTLGVTLGVAMAAHPAWTVHKPAHMHMVMLGFVTMMIY